MVPRGQTKDGAVGVRDRENDYAGIGRIKSGVEELRPTCILSGPFKNLMLSRVRSCII